MDYQIKFKKRGFTLIEMILVISILGIFSTMSLSFNSKYRNNSYLKIVTYDIVEALRYAQSNSQSMKEDSSWGVKISSNDLVIFKGNSYNSRDQNFDKVLDFPNGFTISGNDEVVFEKVTGITTDTGTTTITNSEGANNIYINERGTLTY